MARPTLVHVLAVTFFASSGAVGCSGAAASGLDHRPDDADTLVDSGKEDAGASPRDGATPDSSTEKDSSVVTAESGGPDGGVDTDAEPAITWATVEPLFATYCSQCHGGAWESCPTVRANAQNIDSMVSSGAMPRNRPMPANAEATMLTWLEAGAICPPGEDDAGPDAEADVFIPPPPSEPTNTP